MGIGAAGAVAVAVLLSLTFVPALLAVAGQRAVRGKTFSAELHDAEAGEKPTMGARWIALVIRRRWIAIVAVTLGLLALAAPALHMRLGLPDDGTAAPATTQRQAYDLLSTGFGPGFNGPLTVVADLDRRERPAQAAKPPRPGCGTLDGVAAVAPPFLNAAKDLAIITVVPTSGPSSAATTDLVKAIRADAPTSSSRPAPTCPSPARPRRTSTSPSGCPTRWSPYLAVVVGLAMLLLMIAFRSLLVPLTAIAGFLLTIVASFGVVTLVFQDGVRAGLFGVAQTGPLVSLLPILIIGVIFGLAMDYQVFLVSRMREEFSHGATPRGRRPRRVPAQRPGRHRRRADHDLGLLRLHPPQRPDHQVHRPRVRRRHPDRRLPGPDDADPRADDRAGPARLVAAALAGPDRAERRHRGRLAREARAGELRRPARTRRSSSRPDEDASLSDLSRRSRAGTRGELGPARVPGRRRRLLRPAADVRGAVARQRTAEVLQVDLPAGAVEVQGADRQAALLDHQPGPRIPRAVSQASIWASSSVPGSVVSSRWCGASQTSIRAGPLHVLVKTAWTVPPSRRSPDTSAIQRASRSGVVHAPHRSSMSVSYTSSTRTAPGSRRAPASSR